MQRKSLYLAIDFIDRYLSRINDVQKKSLQLIGVTALFIASKSEVCWSITYFIIFTSDECNHESLNLYFQEIYPPKLSDFSFITDGACTSNDILRQELELIQVNLVLNISLLLIIIIDTYGLVGTNKFLFLYVDVYYQLWHLSEITLVTSK